MKRALFTIDMFPIMLHRRFFWDAAPLEAMLDFCFDAATIERRRSET